MRVLLMTLLFDPETAIKGLIFAKGLQARGYDVEVITTYPNYPGGRVYPGYKMRWLQRECIEGVPVARVPIYISHDRSALKRIVNYVSFALTAALYGLFFAKKPDVIYAYHPPVAVGAAAVVVGFFRRAPFIYDVQDLWPDSLHATGMIRNEKLIRAVDGLCKWIYQRAAHVIVLSDGFRRTLLSRDVPAEKISVVHNWSDEEALRNAPHLPLPVEMHDRFNVLFAGNMGKAQSLGVVIHAAKLVAERNPKVQLVFVGDGVEKGQLKELVASLNIRNVLFLPRKPIGEIGAFLRSADALLVHLEDDPLFSITVPSKTQAYLAIGRPILMAVSGDAAELIRAAGAGVIAKPGDSESVASAVLELAAMSPERLDEMARSGAAYYREHLSLEEGIGKTDRVLRKVLAPDLQSDHA